jgi:hypothetical protein
MALVLGINSYATIEEADNYFESRIDVATWESADDTLKEQALVSATRYLDTLAYTGYVTDSDQSMSWPRIGSIYSSQRGRDIQFKKDYTWTELGSTDFTTNLYNLPLEIRLIKTASIEQAYHYINNDGLLDNTGGLPDRVEVGSITIDGLNGNSETPSRSRVVSNLIKPLLINGGSSQWFRSN